MLKLESNANQGEFIEVNLNTSNEGVNPSENWQTFSFDVSDLVDSTLDPSAIDVIMIFPAWGTGADAVYRVDNMFFTADTSGGSRMVVQTALTTTTVVQTVLMIITAVQTTTMVAVKLQHQQALTSQDCLVA